jgi:SPP1 family predicted phage head-tail adaptor
MAKPLITAGELTTRITFQRSTKTKLTSGQIKETWADACTVFAAMITTGGREFYAAQKINAETTAVFKTWHRADINTRMRIKVGNRIFEILPPLNNVDNKNVALLISAKEVV